MAADTREARAVTIYDVAERVGLSITTVSNALNKPDRVGRDTLQRVLAAIDELGFTPKAAAASQARNGVGRIGVIAPFTSYASFRTRLVGVLNACQDRAVEVVVFDQESAAEASSPLLSALPLTGRFDGLLIMGLPLEDVMAQRLARRKLATVLIDSFHQDLSTVNIDDHHGGYLVGQYLASKGHRNFAYVSERQESNTFVSQGQKRLGGFIQALSDAGIDESETRHVLTTRDLAGGQRAAAEIMTLPRLPHAVFGHFDEIAAGLVRAFRSRGLRVPGDIAVIGYDDGELAEAFEITTVHQPFADSGEAASLLLLDQLSGRTRRIQHVTLPTELIVRATA